MIDRWVSRRQWGRGALVLALTITGVGCHAASDTVLEPVHQLLDELAVGLPQGAPRACALDDDIRPALGCVARFPVATEEGLRPDGGVIRRRYPVPSPFAAGSFVVTPLTRSDDYEGWKPLPAAVVRGAHDDIEVAFAPPGDPSRPLALSVFLVPLPPPSQLTETRPLTLDRGAFLRVSIAIDTVGLGKECSPVEFRLVAKRLGTEHELLRRVLDPAEDGSTGWTDYRLDLDALAGQPVGFAFVTRVLPRGGRSDETSCIPLWGAPHVVEPRPRGRRPNVLLISVDTLRADAVGVYGSELPTTPELDRLAAESTVFERVIATYPATATSHASMFTGLYPAVHGVFGPVDRLPGDAPTLAEVLRAHGYETAAVTEDGMLVGGAGFQRGFAYYRERKGANLWDTSGQVDATFADGLDWVTAHRGERFCLFLHTYQVHDPYTPPPAFDLFRSYRVDGREEPITPATQPAIRSHHAYAGEVRYVDNELRRLWSGLSALGEADRTLLVFTSDHGEEFAEHGFIGHGVSLYDEVLRVPLVLRRPGLVPAGLRVPAVVSLTDLMPTILDLLGIPAPPTVQGTSLVPLLRDPRATGLADRVVFSELRLHDRYVIGVRRAGFKWILPQASSEAPEVYDLDRDPAESHSIGSDELLARGRALVAEYRARASSLTARLADRHGLPESPGPTLDARTVEKLRALGYVHY